MPRSLTLAAARNADRLRAAAGDQIASDTTGVLAQFRAFASSAVFSTNVSADKIAAFDACQAIVDARTLAQHQAGGDRRAGLRSFQREQSKYFTRRVRFEALWREGRRLVYGALNAGGMGTERSYGPFCVVIADPAAHDPAGLAVFPGNSALRYCSPEGVVDSALAYAEAAPWDDRDALATVERGADALAEDPRDWPRAICTPQRYLEAAVAPGPPLAGVDAVRIRRAYRERLEDLRLQALDGSLQPGTAAREVGAYETLRRWRRSRAIAIESVG
jgi:hypothetical protein